MSAFLSPVGGAGWQFFDSLGNPLSGGKLYTYLGGSVNTAQATWTTSTQAVQNANPIILGSDGRPANEIWLADGVTYKFVLQDSNGNQLGSWDNLSGINVSNLTVSEWVTSGMTPTYVDAHNFTVPGNQTAIFQPYRRVRFAVNSGTYYGYVSVASYVSVTTVTIVVDSTIMDSSLSLVDYALLGATNSSVPQNTGINAVVKAYFDGFYQSILVSGTTIKTVNSQSLLGSGNITIAAALATTINSTVTTNTTIAGSGVYVPIQMSAMGKSVTVPDATSLGAGAALYIMDNTKGSYSAGIRDNTGNLLTAVAPGGEAYMSLKDASTQAGVWSVTGTNLEPGLITIDATFSSSYSSTVLAPFVSMDSNTTIHFAALSSGFAAFIVDNSGEVVTTPITVTATANSVPVIAYKITSTTAIVFYGESSTNNRAVVLTISGSSPSLVLSAGTPVNFTTDMGSTWGGEDFSGPPKVVQLSTTLYLASYSISLTNITVVAASVSGAVISVGSAVNITTTNVPSTASHQTYALTSSTGLVLYKSSAGGKSNFGVVVSVSGNTCTVATPVALTGCASSTNGPASSCLLSATKCLVMDDNNVSGSVICNVFTIAGTVITAGTAVSVETGATSQTFTTDSATRWNPHLSAISSSAALLWYFASGSKVSRAAVVSESAGVMSAGGILYTSISNANTGSATNGAIGTPGTAEFISVLQAGATSSGAKTLVSHKISGTTITYGNQQPSAELGGVANANAVLVTKLTQGDYLAVCANAAAVPVFRSNGDAITMRGRVSIPNLVPPTTYPIAKTSNRLVLMASTQGTSVGASTQQLRLLNIEVAA